MGALGGNTAGRQSKVPPSQSNSSDEDGASMRKLDHTSQEPGKGRMWASRRWST